MKRVAFGVVGSVILGLVVLGSRGSGELGAATPVPTNPTLPSNRVTFHAGWNLVSELVAARLTEQLNDEPAYTFAAGDSSYRTVVFDAAHPPSFQPAGPGYWAYLPADVQASIPQFGPMSGSFHINPGWTMIGSEAGAPLRVIGADAVLLYDPVAAMYAPSDRLDAGGGAWAYSAAGADISFGP